jgi:hypothetical protein
MTHENISLLYEQILPISADGYPLQVHRTGLREIIQEGIRTASSQAVAR